MEVLGLKAEFNLDGNRIDLVWTNPTDAAFRGVKILRRETSYPELSLDLGTPIQIHDEPAANTPAGAQGRFSDFGLKSETVYYYMVASYDGSLPAVHFPVFTSAMATGDYQNAAIMYKKLPALYQRFDVLKPPDAPELDPAVKDKGQLERFLEIVGPQLDLIRSFARATRTFSDVQEIDEKLLPLLASTIGWQTGVTLSLAKQRNEVSYAPHLHRTTGIAANLQTMLNRITPWKAEIKEFVHNVFLSNEPEQLPVWEIERVENPASAPRMVTLDMAYEGRPTTLQAADRRQWMFYHSRQSVRTADGLEDRSQIYYKIRDDAGWLPSRQLTQDGAINKYPAAVQRPNGSFWLFWTSYEPRLGRLFPQIKLAIFSAGRDARRPRISATLPGPFAFVDGELFRLTIINNGVILTRTLRLRQNHFNNIALATSSELAELINREIPKVKATVTDQGNLVVEAEIAGLGASLTVPASTVATKIGLAVGITAGANATSAQLTSRAGAFVLSDGLTLSIRVDAAEPTQVVFKSGDFSNIALASAAEVATVINQKLPGVAQEVAGAVRLTSPSAGESSLIAIMANDSTAVAVLGFGAPLPPALPGPADDSEPTTFQDAGNNVWLFWSSRRNGPWNIWYNRFDGTNWGVAKRLTSGSDSDREPSALFDPAGRIWVFWSRKKINLWNVVYRTTTTLNFAVLNNAAWSAESELAVAAGFENKEPAGVVTAANTVGLFYASNVTNGWHIKSVVVTPAGQASDQAITSGQFSHRTPCVLRAGAVTRLLFRSNESLRYSSTLYPIARTLDARYGGSTTIDTENALKIGTREKFSDVQRYTFDTDTGAKNWYARNALGLFISATTNDQKLIERTSLIIASEVDRFLPIQVRVVLIVSSQAGFLFLRTWKTGTPISTMPNLNVAPPDLSFRLFQSGATEGV